MKQVSTSSFTINGKDQKDLFSKLLLVAGYTIDQFAVYMEIEVAELESAPVWAINYLKDTIHLNLVHLGYVMKDTRTDGILIKYKELEEDIKKDINENSLNASQTIILDQGIVTEGGAINVAYIANSERLLQLHPTTPNNQ